MLTNGAMDDCPHRNPSSVGAELERHIDGQPSNAEEAVTHYELDGDAHKMTLPDGTLYKDFYGTGWQRG